MFFRAFLFLVLSLSLSACVSDPYKIDDDQIENAATIQGYSQRDGFTTWMYLRIESIDGKSSDYPLFSGFDHQIPIAPGKRRVVVGIQANNGGGGCPCEGVLGLDVLIEPNAAYVTKARIEGEFAEVWVEDIATSTPVTRKRRLRAN